MSGGVSSCAGSGASPIIPIDRVEEIVFVPIIVSVGAGGGGGWRTSGRR